MDKKYKVMNFPMPLIAAFLGVAGSLVGAYVGSSLSNDTAKDLAELNYKNELLQQRIRILDRAALVYGKAPGVQDIWSVYKQKIENQEVELLELSKRLAEYNSEFNAVIHLSNIYFGPRTHEALKAIGETDSRWWEKENELVKNYLGAMASELKYGIE